MDPCENFGYEDGIQVLDDISKEIGCKPQHWQFGTDLPGCSLDKLTVHRQQVDNALYNSNRKSSIKPCRSIYDLNSDYAFDTAFASCDKGKETVDFTFIYDDLPFREFTAVPAYDGWALFASIVQIIGILFSILPLPCLFGKLVGYCKQHLPKHQNEEENKDGKNDTDGDNRTSNILLAKQISAELHVLISKDLDIKLEKITQCLRKELQDGLSILEERINEMEKKDKHMRTKLMKETAL